MRTPLAVAALAALAPLTLGQAVSVSVQGPTSAQPGDTVTVNVIADVTGLPSSGAIGGFGLDLDITAGATAVTGISAATIDPTFLLGDLPGTPGASSLERAVGGQLININGLNPGVEQGTSLTLFTADITIDPAAANGSNVTVAASASQDAGIVLYNDVTSGASLRLPGAVGTSLSFADLQISIGATPCPGDADGDSFVGKSDLLVLLANWGSSTSNGAADGDFDEDDFVGTSDLLVLLSAWGTSC
jgi:hypothetical protein